MTTKKNQGRDFEIPPYVHEFKPIRTQYKVSLVVPKSRLKLHVNLMVISETYF